MFKIYRTLLIRVFFKWLYETVSSYREEPIDYGTLDASIREHCGKLGLKDVDGFVSKCIQLYETTVVRHGLMLVGPAGSGKTMVSLKASTKRNKFLVSVDFVSVGNLVIQITSVKSYFQLIRSVGCVRECEILTNPVQFLVNHLFET